MSFVQVSDKSAFMLCCVSRTWYSSVGTWGIQPVWSCC